MALREKESRLEEITGDKIKIVERGGKRLENILTGSDSWKGQDCGRKNCFLCITKNSMEKKSNKDCTKTVCHCTEKIWKIHYNAILYMYIVIPVQYQNM